MGKHYFSWEENEAYKEGRRDEERHRHNYERDKYSDKDEDRAYFDGRKDEQREEREREEEREEEERQIEEAHRVEREKRIREEEEYNRYLQTEIEEQMRAERKYYEDMASKQMPPDETPITEEELFRDIRKDEINELGNEF